MSAVVVARISAVELAHPLPIGMLLSMDTEKRSLRLSQPDDGGRLQFFHWEGEEEVSVASVTLGQVPLHKLSEGAVNRSGSRTGLLFLQCRYWLLGASVSVWPESFAQRRTIPLYASGPLFQACFSVSKSSRHSRQPFAFLSRM